MNSRLLFEIILLFLLILLNGLFALAELAIVSSRRERLQALIDDGHPGAVIALRMLQEPTALLSTAQVGITLIGILAGAFGGAALTDELALWLEPLPGVGPYSRTIALIIVVGAITFFSVVLGELVPKRLALRNPERIAASVARPMSLLATIARPVVRVLTLATAFFLRLLGVSNDVSEQVVTEEEIKLLVEQGTRSGVFEEAERVMVESIFHLGDRRLRSLMTPRTELVWLDVNDAEPTIRETISQSPHTRFPVGDRTLDHIVGFVHTKDLLSHSWAAAPFDLLGVQLWAGTPASLAAWNSARSTYKAGADLCSGVSAPGEITDIEGECKGKGSDCRVVITGTSTGLAGRSYICLLYTSPSPRD